MSTRSVIAVSNVTGTDFIGVFHHWDGYPSGVGKALYTLYRERFGRDLEAMTQTLIYDRPSGWDSIVANWTNSPEPLKLFNEDQLQRNPPTFNTDDSMIFMNKDSVFSTCRWVYVLSADDRTLRIYRANTVTQWYGESQALSLVQTVILDALPPDWAVIDDMTETAAVFA